MDICKETLNDEEEHVHEDWDDVLEIALETIDRPSKPEKKRKQINP